MAANSTRRLRVVIACGDESERARIRAMLDSIEPLESVCDAATAPQARRMIEDTQPDFVLLDIDMPGAAGIEPLRVADPPCLAVMTAHPGRALPDFDLEAVDYLVKPLQRDRIALCLSRVRKRLAERRIAELALEIAGAAAAMQGLAPLRAGPSGSRFADQMTIRVRRRMFALPVADITWIEGASQYSRVHAKGGEYLLSRSLSSLECELDPMRFFRIHRSAIVNIDRIKELEPWFHGEYIVIMRDGTRLTASRVFSDRLSALIA